MYLESFILNVMNDKTSIISQNIMAREEKLDESIITEQITYL